MDLDWEDSLSYNEDGDYPLGAESGAMADFPGFLEEGDDGEDVDGEGGDSKIKRRKRRRPEEIQRRFLCDQYELSLPGEEGGFICMH
jgi:hypothetical protein